MPLLDIDVRILDERLRQHMPTYATPGSAGLDLRACRGPAAGLRRLRQFGRIDEAVIFLFLFSEEFAYKTLFGSGRLRGRLLRLLFHFRFRPAVR